MLMSNNIGFDLDGVLYSWHRAVHTELSVYWGLKEDWYEFWSITHATYKNDLFWDGLVRLKHLYTSQPPNKEDLEFVNNLSGTHTIYYITNRPKEVQDVTYNWLKKYKFPTPKNLIVTPDKVAACNSLGIQTFIEDRTENIIKLIEAGIHTIIVRQPYNEKDLWQFPNNKVINKVSELKGYF